LNALDGIVTSPAGLSYAPDLRYTDKGRQGGHQVDAAVMSFVCRQCCPSPDSCACLQFRQFPEDVATPEPITDWPLTTLNEKLIKIGAKAVSRGRYVAFQMAEVATSFSCVISTCNAGLLVDPLADARKNLLQSQHERLATGHEHERLRLIGEFEKPPGQAYRNDIVFVAVQDEDGNMHVGRVSL
jgi:hypothetical protein